MARRACRKQSGIITAQCELPLFILLECNACRIEAAQCELPLVSLKGPEGRTVTNGTCFYSGMCHPAEQGRCELPLLSLIASNARRIIVAQCELPLFTPSQAMHAASKLPNAICHSYLFSGTEGRIIAAQCNLPLFTVLARHAAIKYAWQLRLISATKLMKTTA